MKPNLSDKQLADLLSSEGMSLSAIVQAAQAKGQQLGSVRSLQRQLQRLVASKTIRVSGLKKGARYTANPMRVSSYADTMSEMLDQPPMGVSEGLASYGKKQLPLSTLGQEIQAYVRKDLTARKPVGYQIELLEDYTPNHSFYLSHTQREQLMQMGRGAMHVQNAAAPAGTFARDILDRLLIDLSWSSSRLEGNTYSRLDTQKLIEEGLAAPGKDALQAQMILNHKRAIEYLVHGAGQAGKSNAEKVGVNRTTVIALHALLSDGLLTSPRECGALRTRVVGIGASVYLPLAMPQRIAELFAIVLEMAAEIADPFEQSFFLMVHLPYLQPFIDVNKRTSRLAANIPLIERNLCPLSFIDVPTEAYTEGLLGVYELGRTELLADVYMWAYERSCQQYLAAVQQMVPPDPLRLRYRRELSECIAGIIAQGLDVSALSVQACMPQSVSESDRVALGAIALTDLGALHAGNAIRFGISGLQFQAWEEQLQENS
jgi:Fic/DOC family